MILLKPARQEFEHMKKEVECREHPEHIVTSSPEQDYLTRYFWHTPHWTHIDVSYNFQVHHLALRLPDSQKDCERRQVDFEDVRIIHFSAHPKPSQRDPGVSVSEFAEQMMGRYEGVLINIKHDPQQIERRNSTRKFPKLELRTDLDSGHTKLFEESGAKVGTQESDNVDVQFTEITVAPAELQRFQNFVRSCVQAWADAEEECKKCHGSPLVLESFPAEVGSHLRGICVQWDRARGSGRIAAKDGSKPLFVHHSQVLERSSGGRANLTVGEHVSFTVGLDEKQRLTATAVTKEPVLAQNDDVKEDPQAVQATPQEAQRETAVPILQERVCGLCTSWNASKRFGFVSCMVEGQIKEIFLHHNDVLMDAKGGIFLVKGQVVYFHIIKDPQAKGKDTDRPKAILAVSNEKDEEFVREVQEFARSDASSKSFPPGTPWQRKLLHEIAKGMHLYSRSEGEGEERFVRLTKQEEGGPSGSEIKMSKLQAHIEEIAETQSHSDWRVLVRELTGHERELLRVFCMQRGLQLCRVETPQGEPCQHFVCKQPAAPLLFN